VNTAELLESIPGLSPDHRAELGKAINHDTGRLLESAPDRETFPHAWGVWQSVVGTQAASRVDVAGMMFAGTGSAEMAGFNAGEAAQAALALTAQGLSGVSVFRALVASTEPFRWNADYINYDMDVTRANILAALSAREVV